MKILDWINKILKRNNIKRLEAPKESKENDWKNALRCQSNISMSNQNLTQEEMRAEQIKSTSFDLLYREKCLLRDDIINGIEKNFGKVVLREEEIYSLVAIHSVIEYEDMHAENNIREFIDEDNNNIIRLVDKLSEYANILAKKYETQEVWQFVPNEVKIVDRLKNQIRDELENNKENDESEEHIEGE